MAKHEHKATTDGDAKAPEASAGSAEDAGVTDPGSEAQPEIIPASRYDLIGGTSRAIDSAFDRMRSTLQHRPLVGAALAGAVGLAAANLIGVGEVALAAGAGYAMYQALTKRSRQGNPGPELRRAQQQPTG